MYVSPTKPSEIFGTFFLRMVVIDLFESTVVSYPNNPALVLEDGNEKTYDELNVLATKIQQLVFQTIDPASSDTPLVTVMIERNISFFVAMLGVLKAGAAYVPIDPAFPPDRQIYIFQHSQCKFLIIDDNCYSLALSLGVELPSYIKLDQNGNIVDVKIPNISSSVITDESIIRRYRASNANERLSYVLYTSGSTGKPKGVMVKSMGVINIINWFADALKIDPTSRVMSLTTFCFDISVLEMCLPLTRGGALIVAKSSTQKDPFRLLSLIQQHRVGVFQATPTTYEMMLATGWTGDPTLDLLV
jgi:non-ribosomal peptide synthetase component F